MRRLMCRSKVHRATVTDANAADQGSITLDPALMEAAELLELEGMQVVNRPNGARFETYINAGESGSGENRIVEGGDGEGRRRQVEVS